MQSVTITEITPLELESLIEQSVKKALALNSQNSTQNDLPEILDVNQISKFLGLSVPTIYGYTQSNKIPFNKKSRKLYFLKSEILQWIKSGRVKTISEIEAEADEQYSTQK